MSSTGLYEPCNMTFTLSLDFGASSKQVCSLNDVMYTGPQQQQQQQQDLIQPYCYYVLGFDSWKESKYV